jgi:phosphomannomutase
LESARLIYFGTDGWRGVIADDFNFDNVRIVTQAICDYVKSGSPEPVLAIGYDTRFLSDKFARAAAEVAAGNGIKILLTDGAAPTPAVSYTVANLKTDGAIMFTASHNPYKYNGLKFKAPYGGSASPEITGAIEARLEENLAADKQPASAVFEEAVGSGLIKLFDAKEPYLARLGELVDMDLIKGKRMGVLIDPMFGAGSGYLSEFLRRADCQVLEIHGERDPYFGGGQPEPLAKHLGELIHSVTREWPLGIALDGDADRIGAVDFTGDFISSHMIIAILLRYLHKEKGMSGEVVKTVSTTGMVDLLAADLGLTVRETPIGFKYICDEMLAHDVIIGGEESGGIGVKGHIPERDGMLIGALLVELMCYYGKTLAELWADLESEYGVFRYDRIDLEVEPSAKDAVLAAFPTFNPSEINAVAVETINRVDGHKYCLADGSWLMFRPSGTEPVVRIYAEASSDEKVAELLRFGRKIVLDTK